MGCIWSTESSWEFRGEFRGVVAANRGQFGVLLGGPLGGYLG